MNKLDKVIEIVVASRITALSEKHCLLLDQHMVAFPEKPTDIALNMLIKPVHAAWQADNEGVSMFPLNITEAINRVVPVHIK